MEDIRHTRGNREIYTRRKGNIERIFEVAKEQHVFRYTQYIGKARIEMKAGRTFAYMSLKGLKRRAGTAVQGRSTYFKEDIILRLREKCWSLTPALLFVNSLKNLQPQRTNTRRRRFYVFCLCSYIFYDYDFEGELAILANLPPTIFVLRKCFG